MLAEEYPFELFCASCNFVFAYTWRAHAPNEPLVATNFVDMTGRPFLPFQRLPACNCQRGTKIQYRIRPRT